MVPQQFVHCHVHSHFSLTDGVPSVSALVHRAQQLGMSALALTDHNSLGGIVEFTQTASSCGLQPIIGCELDVLSFEASRYSGSPHHLTLIVENETGYRNLVSLITLAHKNGGQGRPYVAFNDLTRHSSGLLALTGCMRGELAQLLLGQNPDLTERYLEALVRAFGSTNVYFELQDTGEPQQAVVNARLIQLSHFLGIPTVATNDVHYLHPEEEVCFQFLRRAPVRPDTTVDTLYRPDMATRHLASEAEMREKFAAHPRALQSTIEIARRCSFVVKARPPRFPVLDFDRGQDAESFLWDLAFREATKKYGFLSNEVKDRLNEEFDYIKNNGLIHCIILLQKLTQFLHEKHIIKGIGKGNIISSIVAYVLGLTDVDPLEYHIKFQGFGIDKARSPVLSIEVPTKHLQTVMTYLQQLCPESCLAAVGKYQYWHKGTLLTELCLWANVPRHRIGGLLASPAFQSQSSRVKDSLNDYADHKPQGLALTNPQILSSIITSLHPRPRALKAMAGQLVISGEHLNNLVPRQFSEIPLGVTQMEASSLDLLGLPHFNISVHPLLDILDDTIIWIRNQENRSFGLEKIPLNDTATFQLLGRGLTNGVPPFHSITLKSLLRVHRPRNILQLLKVKSESSLNRTKAAESDGNIVHQISDCILTYWCAYLKAHYPVSFMTAILTNSYQRRKQFTILLREARYMGIRILLPDINLSGYRFTQEGKAIRTGLMVVHGMGEKAFHEIETERKGGPFNDLEDLCKRTDPKLLHARLIVNMIKTGVLDSFGTKRSQMLQMLPGLIQSTRQKEEGEDDRTPSFFDLPGVEVQSIASSAAASPEVPELPLETLIKCEIDAAGYAITYDPLSPYHNLIRRMRAISPYAIMPKLEGTYQYLVGYIDHIDREGPLVDNETALILDFEGYLVSVPPKVAKRAGRAFTSTLPVVIGGRICGSKNQSMIRANHIQTLPEVQKAVDETIRITLNLTGENVKTLKMLGHLAKTYPGKTKFEFKNYPAKGKRLLHKLTNAGVFFCPPLYRELKKMLPEKHILVHRLATYSPKHDFLAFPQEDTVGNGSP
jgi:DNA polymerase III alpha subunit